MKVLLVQSFLGGREPLVYPLGLSCLKSALNGHETRLFDTNTSAYPFSELGEVLSGFRPDVVGISLRNIDSTNKRTVVFYYSHLKKTVDVIKTHSTAKIVVGGSGFSMFARRIMEDEPRIDLGLMLEGERTFPALLDNLEKPAAVQSVFYRENGDVIYTGPCDPVDLDAAALPDRTALSLESYTGVPEAIGIETKRGCILGCVYCIYAYLNGKKLRERSVSKVVDEIEDLVERYGVSSFTFIDSVFNVPTAHSEEICREIIRRGLRVNWSAWFNERRLTGDSVKLAVQAGCNKFIFSPDGFSDSVLTKLGKDVRMKDIMNSYNILKGMDGFEVVYNFFKNPPGQSLRAFTSLIGFYIRAKKEMGTRVHFEFNSMRIEPHTKLLDIAAEEGFVTKHEDLLYPKYYSNKKTRYIEAMFDLMLMSKGK